MVTTPTEEVRHEQGREPRRERLLSRAPVSAAADTHRRPASSVAIASFAGPRSCMSTWAITIRAHADQGDAFKRCCRDSGRFRRVVARVLRKGLTPRAGRGGPPTACQVRRITWNDRYPAVTRSTPCASEPSPATRDAGSLRRPRRRSRSLARASRSSPDLPHVERIAPRKES